VRLSLDLVEEEIATDSTHRLNRLELDGIIYDKTQPGVMVSWKMIDGVPVLLSFADLWDR